MPVSAPAHFFIHVQELLLQLHHSALQFLLLENFMSIFLLFFLPPLPSLTPVFCFCSWSIWTWTFTLFLLNLNVTLDHVTDLCSSVHPWRLFPGPAIVLLLCRLGSDWKPCCSDHFFLNFCSCADFFKLNWWLRSHDTPLCVWVDAELSQNQWEPWKQNEPWDCRFGWWSQGVWC